MPIDYAQELIKLAAVSEPTEQPTPKDWNALEAELGMEFPSDYKTLLTGLGSGWFGNGVYFGTPSCSAEWGMLSRNVLLDLGEMLDRTAQMSGVTLYPERAGLVSVGRIDRQYFLLRPNQTGTCLQELVWWDTDAHELEDLHMSVPQLIHDLYLGRISEEWAADLREYFWPSGTEPFFTVWRGPTPGLAGYLPKFLRNESD